MSDWISVKDELPPERIEVLFYIKELNQIELGKYHEVTEKWIIPNCNSYYQNGINWVTHWMQLPETP